MFEVQSGVPMTSARRGRKATTFPFEHMEIGDSFLIPFDVTAKNEVTNWRRKVLIAKKTFGKGSFTTATVSDGIRVWRTA